MSEPLLLVAYRAMPSHVLEERIRLMQTVIAERASETRGNSYIKQVAKKECPAHLTLEPLTEGPPPTDGAVINFRGLQT
jgi:hypothetical protein